MAGAQLQKTCKDNLLWRKRDKDYRVTKSEHFSSINVAGIILLGFFAVLVLLLLLQINIYCETVMSSKCLCKNLSLIGT